MKLLLLLSHTIGLSILNNKLVQVHDSVMITIIRALQRKIAEYHLRASPINKKWLNKGKLCYKCSA